MVTIKLPYPPSVNHYWRSLPKPAGRVVISKAGLVYRAAVVGRVMVERPFGNYTEDDDLMVEVVAMPPDRRRRDIDNVLKALFDSIVHAKLIHDDSQISRLIATRLPYCPEEPKGAVLLSIMTMKQARGESCQG